MSLHEDVTRLRAHLEASCEYAERVLPELVERQRRDNPGRYDNLIECCRALIKDGGSMAEDARWLEHLVRRHCANISLSGIDPMGHTREERWKKTKSSGR